MVDFNVLTANQKVLRNLLLAGAGKTSHKKTFDALYDILWSKTFVA